MSKKKCDWCKATTYKSYYKAGWQSIEIKREGEPKEKRTACPMHFKEFKEWYKCTW